MDIKLIPHHEIDKTKWNSCVHYATNGNVFGYKWYLDAVAKEWAGLIEGDYESVLPLFITEKPQQLAQPQLLREAGIYSIHVLSLKRIHSFLKAIPEKYTDIRMQFNEGINQPEKIDFNISTQTNYQLILLDSYKKINEKYSSSLLTRLDQIDRSLLLPSSNVKPEKIAELFKSNSDFNRQNEIAFHTYQRIMYNALHRGWGATFGVTDKNKILLSAAFFIYAQGRVMQLLAATNQKGKELGAYEYLIDNFLQSHAGRPLVMDFNTSENYPTQFGAFSNTFLRLEKSKKPFWKVW